MWIRNLWCGVDKAVRRTLITKVTSSCCSLLLFARACSEVLMDHGEDPEEFCRIFTELQRPNFITGLMFVRDICVPEIFVDLGSHLHMEMR